MIHRKTGWTGKSHEAPYKADSGARSFQFNSEPAYSDSGNPTIPVNVCGNSSPSFLKIIAAILATAGWGYLGYHNRDKILGKGGFTKWLTPFGEAFGVGTLFAIGTLYHWLACNDVQAVAVMPAVSNNDTGPIVSKIQALSPDTPTTINEKSAQALQTAIEFSKSGIQFNPQRLKNLPQSTTTRHIYTPQELYEMQHPSTNTSDGAVDTDIDSSNTANAAVPTSESLSGIELAAIAALTLGIVGSAFYYGYYLPNKNIKPTT